MTSNDACGFQRLRRQHEQPHTDTRLTGAQRACSSCAMRREASASSAAGFTEALLAFALALAAVAATAAGTSDSDLVMREPTVRRETTQALARPHTHAARA